MNYISVKDAAQRFHISERRMQKLCESNRISGCTMISGVWLIPEDVQKPTDERLSSIPANENVLSLTDLCKTLSISIATGRNWIKLGKLIPKYTDKRTPYFDSTYVTSLINDLKTGMNNSLKNRRNKKFVFGNSLYNSYVSENCKNLFHVQTLLEKVKSENIDLTEDVIGYFIADCAIHFIVSQKRNKDYPKNILFEDFLLGKLELKEKKLLNAFIKNKDNAINFVKQHSALFSLNYIYEEKEDVLGLIYISCKNIDNRKSTGTYYTPTKIVNSLISSLSLNTQTKLLDPCCGTGNFLLQLPDTIPFSNIYGNDIDPVSIKITRINMALKFPEISIDNIISHFTENDYLMNFPLYDFSIIIGNPPWGYDFSDSQKEILRRKYKATTTSNIESYDVFIEQSLKHLHEKGQISFILPEALLNVKAHSDIRKIIKNEANIKEIKFLGNVFDGVQCPCIILRLEKNQQEHSTIGMIINDGTRQFKIKTDRTISSDYFSFLTNDEEYCILEKIKKTENCKFLSGNADFALGIVTGNNKKYISSKKNDNNEIVLRGSDIFKYKKRPSNNYIVFNPEKFQQVAPTEFYRAEEKLFYRFISNQLVFAYDNEKTLSLNSCNIVIPKIDDLNIKYVMSILNSRIAQFLFKKEFNSIKVLRSHIENIPIPEVSSKTQEEIINFVDCFIENKTNNPLEALYDELDEKICKLFNLSVTEQNIIKNAVDGENKFL